MSSSELKESFKCNVISEHLSLIKKVAFLISIPFRSVDNCILSVLMIYGPTTVCKKSHHFSLHPKNLVKIVSNKFKIWLFKFTTTVTIIYLKHSRCVSSKETSINKPNIKKPPNPSKFILGYLLLDKYTFI